jgi:hypothetical protein
MSSVASLLSGTPAASAPVVAVAQGTTTIALGATESAQILNANVRASSIIVAWIAQAGADGTMTSVSVRVQPTVGFSVTGSAASTAAVTVGWAILKL